MGTRERIKQGERKSKNVGWDGREKSVKSRERDREESKDDVTMGGKNKS